MCSQQSTVNSQQSGGVNFDIQLSLPLSKSVRARELVLDALNGREIEIEDENDDIFVLSRALKQCTMHNAQCTIFAISENNQACLDCRAEQKSQPEGVIFAISENNQACLDCRAEQKSRQKGVMHNAQLSDQLDNFQLSTLNSQLSTFNLHASGTALRFLTAYCAVTEGEWVLSGTERLCERPIRPLVDALRGMGAEIEYVEKEGFAPLKIVGRKLKGGLVRLDASLSSQFASALMLIADKVDGGIEIEYEGDVASKSYISLTKSVIEKYKRGVRYSGEKDWSSATVWYAAMAVLKEGKFLLEGLSLDSCQPDRAIVEIFEKLGVRTMAVENGVAIESSGCVVDKFVLDCNNMPDAVMYIVVAACLLGVEFEISGVGTLRVKESDRIEALMSEMRKCGYLIQCIMHNAQPMVLSLGEKCTIFVEHESRHKEVIHNSQLDGEVPRLKTYNDHRIAMSMAVVGLVREIEIENREVVNKSYPEFWRDFDRVKNIYCK